ncbi:MAG: NAD-dependent epimerase/dehydratase family protein [Candidatus Bathyarchaeota archaeon]|nr:NAD-dependent epimerase/dehydratase family protein [Candidatus Bathyarchaeota archaeon]
MTNLITGGTGFVGSELAKRLLNRGEKVVLFDIAPRYENIESVKDDVIVLRGDLANWSEVLNAVKEYKVKNIFHLGAMLSIPSDANPWTAYRVNANGAMHILEAARLFDVDEVIFTSSIAVYAGYTGPIDESTVQKPDGMYALTKLFGELLGRFYIRKFGIDFRAVRYPTVVGLGAKTKHMSQYMAWMIEHSLANKPFDVWVEEDTRNPCIYYKDAVNALIMLHDAPKENIKNLIYNLAGISLTAREFVDKVERHIQNSQIRFKPDPVAVSLLGKGIGRIDESLARNEWGWKLEFGIDEIIDDMKNEYNKSVKN